MFTSLWLSTLKRQLRARFQCSARARRNRHSVHSFAAARTRVSRNAVEALEDRTLLTTFTVLNTDDSGEGSLRDAIEQANANAGADTIVFDATLADQTIVLSTELSITDDLTITGLGADHLTLDGNGDSRIFKIDNYNSSTEIDVALSGLSLINGNSSDSGTAIAGNGGAIMNQENLTVVDCVITGNYARLGGGGIYNIYGSLTVESSLISENTGEFHGGGGIYCRLMGEGGVSISDSTISFNTTSLYGGGIYLSGTEASITNSTISGNTAGNAGAGIDMNSSASLTVESSTISQNHAGYNAGAIHSGGELLISNSTISGNSSLNVAAGIYTSSSLEVVNSTIVLNYGRSSLSSGAAIYGTSSSLVTISNTIIAENLSASENQTQIAGLFNDNSNIITDSIAGLIDPELRDNGGTVLTHALLEGSAAIDGGTNALATQPDDQRGDGFVRIAGGTVDIGAFEVQVHDLVVDSLSDIDDGDYSTGQLSLREAIKLASLIPWFDTVYFDASLAGQTIFVSDELLITDNLTLVGLGADQLTLDGDYHTRLFRIDNGDQEDRILVTIEGLTLSRGIAAKTEDLHSGSGGAILSYEDLVLKDIIFSRNIAQEHGGAVFSKYASLTVENSLFTENSVGFSGGGIYFRPITEFTLTINESRFLKNSADDYAGAVYLGFGTGSVQSSTFSENTAGEGGGAIWNGGSATLTVGSSTFDQNRSAENGGALYNSGDLTLYNSTLSENSAYAAGGGLYSYTTAPLKIVNSTIVANQATYLFSKGGGIHGSNLEEISIINSIVAGNTAASDPQIFGLYSASFNIVHDELFDLIDPVLSDNGGITKTHALLSDSFALDAGSTQAALNAGLFSDQRGAGYARILGGAVDIGAVEQQPLTFIVDSTSDIDDGDYSAGNFSLREAIRLANASDITDQISFDAALLGQTILLNSELIISDDLTITGWGNGQIILDANHNSRLLLIDDGDLETTISVEIEGLTLQNGSTFSTGGAILSFEDLTIVNSTITGNDARQGGGGIYATNGALTIENSNLSNNSAAFQGGGALMYFRGAGLTIDGSTFLENSTDADGGAIFVYEGETTIGNSSFTSNQAEEKGGAVHNAYLGSMSILSSLFNDNYSDDTGGALSNANELYLRNSTLSNNTADFNGGGIYSYRYTTLEVINSTIVLNHAQHTGGGIYLVSPFPGGTFSNNIIAGNTAANSPQIHGTSPDGSNIVTNSITGLIDPVLRDNGGLTKTHALLPGSAAIDAGNNTFVSETGLVTDQRGAGSLRIVNGTVDIGAFEVQASFAQLDLSVVDTRTSTSASGETDSLPLNSEWLHEWGSYWLEIWISSPSTTDMGILSAALDLTYNTAITTAIGIEYGAAFTLNQTGTIIDLTGTIENLSAETALTDVGDDQHVLFARIQFASTANDAVDLDLEGQSLNPQSPEFRVTQSELVFVGDADSEEAHGVEPETQIYANPYDLNDDDKINFRDLIHFASAYAEVSSTSDSDYAWFADLDKNDHVNFRDLIAFAANYGKTKTDQTAVTYPAGYPDAWDQLLLVDSQSPIVADAPVVSQSIAESAFDAISEQVTPGLSDEQIETLTVVEIEVVDLSGNKLGRAVGSTIYIDVNAAGRGWFVDSTPADHSEFNFTSELTLVALEESDAAGGVDLWTVILHELGHVLGHEHEETGLMQETLAPGERFLPDWDVEIDLFFGSVSEDADLLSF